MPFNPPQPPNLTPLLLDQLFRQRWQEEALAREEKLRGEARAEDAIQQTMKLISQGVPSKEVLPYMRSQGLTFEGEQFALGIEKGLRQRQKAAEQEASLGTAAGGLAAVRVGGTPQEEQALLAALSQQFGPEAIPQIESRAAVDIAQRQAASKARPVSFFDDGGNFIRDEIPGTRGYREAVAANLRPIDTSVQGQKIGDVIANDPVLRRKYIEQAQSATERLGQFTAALRTVNRTDPKAFGARGGVARLLGNVALQITGDEALRQQIAQDIASEDPESLQRLRLVINQAAAASIEVFTGEGTNRVSDKELGITRKILAGLEPTSSQSDVATAMRYLVGSELVNEQVALVKLGRQPRFRLYGRTKSGKIASNSKEFARLQKYLAANGLTPQEATDFAVSAGAVHKALLEQGNP